MSFAKFFQKRSSQKDKKNKTAPKETEICDSSKVEPVASGHLVSEVTEVLQDVINRTVELEESENCESSAICESSDVPNLEKTDRNDSCVVHEANKDEEIETSSKESVENYAKTKRSASAIHFEVSSEIKQSGRRKCLSESESDSLPVNEETLPLRHRNELDKVIEQYVDKLIRDSIMKAVSNVNVDNLYKEIAKDFSNRKNSESAESVENFVVEQRLSSHSICELVDLEGGADEATEENGECFDFTNQSFNIKQSENESINKEYDDEDHALFGGYLADYEDTASVDDAKSVGEDSSYCSMSNGMEHRVPLNMESEKSSETTTQENNISQKPDTEAITNDKNISNVKNEDHLDPTLSLEVRLDQRLSVEIADQEQEHANSESTSDEHNVLIKDANENEQKSLSVEYDSKQEQKLEQVKSANDVSHEASSNKNVSDQTLLKSSSDQEQNFPDDGICERGQRSSEECTNDEKIYIPSTVSACEQEQKLLSEGTDESPDLIVMSPDDECPLPVNDNKNNENENPPDFENLPQQQNCEDEAKKVNWKAGYLQVKLPHKSRSKTHLKAWKKRCVAIQPDEFVNDPKNPSLVISVYGAESRKHKATFWQTVSSQKAVVYRSSSRSHQYAFTISDEGRAIIHLSAESEAATQEWMAAIRSVLWTPSPFMQLEKMLSGREFEISLIDNEFSYHAGLLGMYGYLTITPNKLILLHPQQGYVIQEWYLNTVDKFQLVAQPKVEDSHKVLAMTTCSDSSTGKGEILLFCNEAVTLLQSLASTIHQVLSYRSKQDGGKYLKEMDEMAEWLVAPTQDSLNDEANAEEHYKVPPRQVKSLLDIPNFIFEKSLSPVASAIYPAPLSDGILEPLEATRFKPTTTSQDSGISTCHSGEDILNCSTTSFVIGGGPLTGRSSDSEMSDAYTPPRTPEALKKRREKKPMQNLSLPKA